MSNVVNINQARALRFLAVARVLRARNPDLAWLERIALLAQARAKLDAGRSAAAVLQEMG